MSSKSGVLYLGARFARPAAMVARERQLKRWIRSRKLELIHSHNPEMVDYARSTARDPSRRLPRSPTEDLI